MQKVSLKKQGHKDSMTTLQILHELAMSNACSLKSVLFRTYTPMASTCPLLFATYTVYRIPIHKMSSPQDGSPREMICNEGSASSQATSVESKSGYVTVVLVVAAAGSRTDSLVQTQRTPGRCDVIN